MGKKGLEKVIIKIETLNQCHLQHLGQGCILGLGQCKNNSNQFDIKPNTGSERYTEFYH